MENLRIRNISNHGSEETWFDVESCEFQEKPTPQECSSEHDDELLVRQRETSEAALHFLERQFYSLHPKPPLRAQTSCMTQSFNRAPAFSPNWFPVRLEHTHHLQTNPPLSNIGLRGERLPLRQATTQSWESSKFMTSMSDIYRDTFLSSRLCEHSPRVKKFQMMNRPPERCEEPWHNLESVVGGTVGERTRVLYLWFSQRPILE